MRHWLLACLLLFSSSAWAQWTVELTKDASFVVRYDGTTVVRAKYLAWGPAWKYADFKTAIGAGAAEIWPVSGEIKDLNLLIGGQIKQEGNVTTFIWDLKSGKSSRGNIGGGLAFTLRLDPQVFGPDAPKPQLAGSGWNWSPREGQTISARFEGMKSACYFEKGKPDQIRAFFIPQDIDPGTRTVTMTLTLPDGATRSDGVSKQYAAYDERTWLPKTIDWTSAPVDLSFLNHKPAGAKGFVRADGEKLVFEDGSEARFWGANVVAYALFNATDEAIEQQAKRIAALGFNLVRIHHHDSADWSPSVFAKDAADTRHLDEKNLERIDYWVKCLKDQGVYVWLDLHVGRPFRGGDGVEGYNELKTTRSGKSVKGFNYVNKSITDRMKEFANVYLTRTNRYTGVRYVDEPAVMGVLITNENDITQHFGNEMLPDKNKPIHQKWMDALRQAIVSERGLDGSSAWKTWEAGPSKVVLNQIEYDWNKDFIAYLRSIGLKVPIATTNTWGADPLFSLPALTAGDVIDVHSYGLAESLASKPQYDDMSSHWIAAAQVADKPLVITEWNTEYPHRDRFTQALQIASQAAFQGWDAPMIYGYQQAPLVPQSKIDNFGISNDPSHVSLMPAAALLYRRGDVKQAEKTVVFAPGEALLLKTISPENSPALRTIAERHRLVIGMPKTPLLPWLKGVETGDIADPMALADGIGQTSIASDTGELNRDWKDGVYTIDTPRTQAVMGWVGGREIALKDVTFSLTTPKATVAVSSLDGEPIASSKRLLISFAAQTNVSGKPLVVRAEPVVGTLNLKGDFSIQPLSPSGSPLTTLNAVDSINLSGKLPTHWFLVSRK